MELKDEVVGLDVHDMCELQLTLHAEKAYRELIKGYQSIMKEKSLVKKNNLKYKFI